MNKSTRLVLIKSEIGLILLKVVPHHSDQQRFYCPTNHPKPWYSFQSLHPSPFPMKYPISLLVPPPPPPPPTPTKKKKKRKEQEGKKIVKKIVVKQSTVMPELVTLDCSL